MQTISGSNGQIGHELAKELYENYTKEIRLVSRKPQKIHDSDELVSADLLDFNETNNAISGSDIVYFTVGLPMDSEMWMKQFSKILDNVIEACKIHQSKLVFLIILICILKLQLFNMKIQFLVQVVKNHL